MRYEGSIYRPPSEAKSVIVQATVGCSHNKCTFCTMYKGKSFRIRSTNEIIKDIDSARDYYSFIRRIFLADGDALIIKTSELMRILHHITTTIPECERIGIYASPKSISTKSLEELIELKKAGLTIAYMGLESGSDRILSHINKDFTSEQIVREGSKLKAAGIQLSVTLINGLGGRELWKEHAIESANAINQLKPDYLGLLTLMVDPSTKLYEEIEAGSFTLLTPEEVALETKTLLEHLDCDGCVFRSNHASNYLPLRGTLNRDKERMIHDLTCAIKGESYFKDESLRGL